MHNEVAKLAGFSECEVVDHIDGNGMNNIRENLRPSSFSQNQGNRKKTPGTSSRFKGVTWVKHKYRQCWKATIKAYGESYFLGEFFNEEDAARAYDEAAIKIFGEFAVLNFPRPKKT